MFFLNPTYLWALLGLAVPIAIHLWSKKEGKTIKIGSIQLLSEADSKQNSSIKLNELWLLLIRLILVALVILIMAEPQIKCNTINTKLTYIIEPALFENKSISKFLDTISTEASFRLLQKNFPGFNTISYQFWFLFTSKPTIMNNFRNHNLIKSFIVFEHI